MPSLTWQMAGHLDERLSEVVQMVSSAPPGNPKGVLGLVVSNLDLTPFLVDGKWEVTLGTPPKHQ